MVVDKADRKQAETRAANADDEIIERSETLAQITGAPVAVITADTSMRLRAQAAGLKALNPRQLPRGPVRQLATLVQPGDMSADRIMIIAIYA